jgi:hypothetical protein
MHVCELFAEARREEFLCAAARDRLAARARRARATGTAPPDPPTARAAAAGLAGTPRGPRPEPGGHRLPDLAVLARRVPARVSTRGRRPDAATAPEDAMPTITFSAAGQPADSSRPVPETTVGGVLREAAGRGTQRREPAPRPAPRAPGWRLPRLTARARRVGAN